MAFQCYNRAVKVLQWLTGLCGHAIDDEEAQQTLNIHIYPGTQ